MLSLYDGFNYDRFLRTSSHLTLRSICYTMQIVVVGDGERLDKRLKNT
jgi:hypothetical protein